MKHANTVSLFGYGVSNRGRLGDIRFASQTLTCSHKPFVMVCANPHSLIVAEQDAEFRDALKGADLLLPDGSGLILAATLLKLPLQEKVAGFDFFFHFSKHVSEGVEEIRYFFLGASPLVLEGIVKRMQTDFPNIMVAGVYSPPFKDGFSDDDNKAMVDAINNSGANVLWVGMTAPKQEKWIQENRDKLHVKIIGAIGAVFDFYAGTKKRSSAFWINLGLEWLPRFFKEPGRLWERNMKSTPIFLYWIFKEKLSQMLKIQPTQL